MDNSVQPTTPTNPIGDQAPMSAPEANMGAPAPSQFEAAPSEPAPETNIIPESEDQNQTPPSSGDMTPPTV